MGTVEAKPLSEQLLLAYRELIGAEAQVGEALSRRGMRIGATVADQWPVLHEYLHLYARGLSPAGVVVFGGRPDEGSRATGIPFTGSREARERMGLAVKGDSRSPSAAAFWGAVEKARVAAGDAPLESLFGTLHLTHAVPFDSPMTPEVADLSRRHVLRVLAEARPQAAVAVGPEALAALGRAVGNLDLVELAAARESTWVERWPPGTRLSGYPYTEVDVGRPFRMRVVPVPSLSGADAERGGRALEGVFSYVLG